MALRRIECTVSCCRQIEVQYEWKVEKFFSPFQKVYVSYVSPDIQFAGRTFKMKLINYHSIDTFNLSLWLEKPNSPITIRYTLGIKTPEGDTEVWASGIHEFSTSDRLVYIDGGNRSELWKRSCQHASCDALTITAYLKTHVSGIDTGTAEVAVQTSVDDAGGQESKGGHQALEHTDFATFCQNIEELKGKDCDVTLEVRGIQFRVHKWILEARAPVLAEMLSDSTAKAETAVMCVEDCHPGTFEVFLRFVYSGVAVNLTSENATDVYYAANKYDLPGLKEECVRHMISHFTTGSICSVIDLAERHGEELLKEKATEFLVENAREVCRTDAWRKFTEENGLAYDLIIRVHKNWK